MAKWLWQLKWLLVIAIFAGPAIAYFSYKDSQRVEHIMAQGASLSVQVDGVDWVQRKRYGVATNTNYVLHGSWLNETGSVRQYDFDITPAYGDQLSASGKLTVDRVTAKYLPSEESDPWIIVEDAGFKAAEDQRGLWFGIIGAIAGIILTPIGFWLERRNARAQADDIDATLAKMRAEAPKS